MPNYSKDKRNENWKCLIMSKMCLQCCNWVAIILYFVVFAIGLKISSKDVYLDLSIYDSAVDDWRTPMW